MLICADGPDAGQMGYEGFWAEHVPAPYLHAQRLGQGLVAVELDLQDKGFRVVCSQLAQLRVQRLAAAAPVRGMPK